MIQTDAITQISMFSDSTGNVYDFFSKKKIPDQFSPIQITLPSIQPVSPSGRFTQTDDNLKSNGQPKATAGDPLPSYTDYKRITDHFLSKGSIYGIRNFALLTIGIATGLRISDITALRFGHLLTLDNDGNLKFREYIDLNEKKTGKRTKNQDDAVLITEAIQQAISILAKSYNNANKRNKTYKLLDLDDFVFRSKQCSRTEFIEDDDTGEMIPNPVFGEYVIDSTSVNKIYKDAQRNLNFAFDFCTRSTRKTFASLGGVFYNKLTNGNPAGIEMMQILLRHSTPKHTLRYMGVIRNQAEEIRKEISNWLLGKSDVENIRL